MLLWIWPKNDGTGLLDREYKDGDVFMTRPDSFEPSIGDQEKKSKLIINIPDPPNMSAVEAELVRSEFAPSQTGGEDNVVRRKRIYTLNWRLKFTEEEIAIIEDPTQVLPDGEYVTSGVVHGLFVINDFSRK